VVTEDKINCAKDRFYEKLEHVFEEFPKYHIRILVGDFNTKLGREDIFKTTIWNESLHKIINDNETLTHLTISVKTIMFTYCIMHKYTWMSPDGKPTIRLTIFW
jgi:exonuclease III